jgi:hypothetical protein
MGRRLGVIRRMVVDRMRRTFESLANTQYLLRVMPSCDLCT